MSKLGLIGNNISYSKSPELHKIIKEEYNLDFTYNLIDINEEEIDNLLKDNYLGFNVTKPFKTICYKKLDKVSKIAKKTKSINTIYFSKNKIHGDNTDYYGFKYLLKYYNIDTKNKHIAILGTGGSANTIYWLLTKKTKNVVLVSRTKKASNIITYDELKIEDYDIFINATPIGTYPNIEDTPILSKLLFNKVLIDLTYNPVNTKFMSQSNKSYNGLIMLIVQALYSQKKWNKIKITKRKVLKIKERLENV